MSSIKITSKTTTATTSASNTPSGSRRNSLTFGSRPTSVAHKTLQEIRDEMMTIMMSKGMFTSPSQPFVL
ncbi:hypothetical protein KI688_000270 [Linnemannia hyalina]|uniref:Uncharacterized protein n=1 Tax=Linnemannia hyalina TaxID=64524 RepID=A0A9P7Y362_9FUNG|nr:hypothetical protein KI688_000270 [Linnemannia hyalina]